MNSTEQVVFNDYPLGVWLTGIGALILGVVMPDRIWERILFALIALPFIGLVPILTVAVDPMRETLHLRYRYLFSVSTKVFSWNEINSVNVQEDREKERMYRVELILRSGQVVPLRSWYSIGKSRHRRRAQLIGKSLQHIPR